MIKTFARKTIKFIVRLTVSKFDTKNTKKFNVQFLNRMHSHIAKIFMHNESI